MSNHPVTPPANRGGLVVDLEHVNLVTAALNTLGIRFTGPEEDQALANERLGLALFTDLREGPLESYEQPQPVGDLDGLLAELRRQFGDARGGWLPLMGKNRPVDGVIRAGTSKPMGYTDPMLAVADLQSAEAVPVVAPTVGAGARVGILDTPLFLHPDFDRDRVHADPELLPPEAPVSPAAGHSTFVASRVLRQAPAAELFVRGVLDSDTGRADSWDTAVAMVELGDTVHILNLSLACFTADGEPPLVIRRAVERMNPEVVIVAAAGNHADMTGWQRGRTGRSPAWPAALIGVTAVGATGPGRRPAPFSPQAPWVDLTARGVDVDGAYLQAVVRVHDTSTGLLGDKVDTQFFGSAAWSGTSFAAATVSGAIAAGMTGGTTARAALARLLADAAAGAPDAVVMARHPVG